MLIVVSPAKALDYSSALPTRKHSQPRMLDEASPLVEVMRQKSPDEIAALMGISAELAELNFERYADFQAPFTTADARPALLAFAGRRVPGHGRGRPPSPSGTTPTPRRCCASCRGCTGCCGRWT